MLRFLFIYRFMQVVLGIAMTGAAWASSNGLVNLNSDLNFNSDEERVVTAGGNDYLLWIQDKRLYSYSLTTNTRVELTGHLPSPFVEGQEDSFYVRGSTVVFVSDNKLYSVPIAGGAPTLLSDNKTVFRHSVILAPVGTMAFFQVQNEGVYATSILGGALNLAIDENSLGLDSLGTFDISPDGNTFVFTANPTTGPTPYSANRGLYSIPVSGGTPVRLNYNGIPFNEGAFNNAGSRNIQQYEITSDSQRVVYVADEENDNEYFLYSVPITGGTRATLSAPPSGASFKISPDGQWVVFEANFDPTQNDPWGFYSVPVSGGTVRRLVRNDVSTGSGSVFGTDVQFSDDSSKVLLWRVYHQASVSEIVFGNTYRGDVAVLSDLTSGTSQYPIPPLNDDSGLGPPMMIPNNQGVVFHRRGSSGQQLELLKTSLSGTGTFNLLSQLPNTNAFPSDFEFSPDGNYALIETNGEVSNRFELFRVNLSDASYSRYHPTITTHSPSIVAFGAIGNDGESAWMRANFETFGETDLYVSAPGLPPLFGPNLAVSRPVVGSVSSGATLAFGNQVVGEVASRSLVLQNTGTDSLNNINFMFSGGHASEYAVVGAPTSIAAGESATVTIQFIPQQAWTTSASLAIASNDADSPHTINLSGTGVNDSDDDPGSDTWETQNGFDPDTNGDVLTLDTDGDGDPDIWELFQGTDRDGAGDSFGFKQTQADAGTKTLSTQFRRSTLSSATSVVTAVGKWSPDLQNWYNSGETVDGVTVTFTENPTDMGDYEIVDVDVSVTGGETPQLFYSLELVPVE